MEKEYTTYSILEDESVNNETSFFRQYNKLKEKHENDTIEDNQLYLVGLDRDDRFKTVIEPITLSKAKTTLTTNKQKVTDNYTVLNYDNWIGEVLSVHEKSFRAQLRHSLGEYSARLVDINKNILNKTNLNGDLKEGMSFYWNFKEISTNKGQIKKVDSLEFLSEIQRPAFEIEEQIKEEMQRLSFLFDGDNDE